MYKMYKMGLKNIFLGTYYQKIKNFREIDSFFYLELD